MILLPIACRTYHSQLLVHFNSGPELVDVKSGAIIMPDGVLVSPLESSTVAIIAHVHLPARRLGVRQKLVDT